MAIGTPALGTRAWHGTSGIQQDPEKFAPLTWSGSIRGGKAITGREFNLETESYTLEGDCGYGYPHG